MTDETELPNWVNVVKYNIERNEHTETQLESLVEHLRECRRMLRQLTDTARDVELVFPYRLVRDLQTAKHILWRREPPVLHKDKENGDAVTEGS